MDPQATWDDMLDALASGDWDRTDEAGRNLLAWLDSGGFPPQTLGSMEIGPDWHRDVAAHVSLLAVTQARNARRAARRA